MNDGIGDERRTQIIAIGNQKGGVGKTTNTVHLAAALVELGRKCLIVDLDMNHGATLHFGVEPEGFLGTFEVLIGERTLAELHATHHGSPPIAALSRLRGQGRGASWSGLITALEDSHPLHLASPFEGSLHVSGAVWDASTILGGPHTASVAKLRWDEHADDLPMHVHEHSDRFIVVHEGRGFFHVSDEGIDRFTGRSVRTVPARERDVFLFTRGVVHTFSTLGHPMTLLSCQLPFLPFDHPAQYRLPDRRWIAAEHRDDDRAGVACDPAWTVLMGGCVPPG